MSTFNYPTNVELRRLKRKYNLTNEDIADLLSTSEYKWGKRSNVHRVNNWLRFDGPKIDPIFLERICKKLGEEISKELVIYT